MLGEQLRVEQAGSSALVVRGWSWIQVLPGNGTAHCTAAPWRLQSVRRGLGALSQRQEKQVWGRPSFRERRQLVTSHSPSRFCLARGQSLEEMEIGEEFLEMGVMIELGKRLGC